MPFVAGQNSLLSAHDAELRTSGEFDGATDVGRIGPLWVGRFAGEGLVSYRDLDGLRGDALDQLIHAAIDYYQHQTDVTQFEWKTRGHDAPAELADHLLAAGLSPEPTETVMAGDAAVLAVDVPLLPGLTLRAAGRGGQLADDVHAVSVLHRRVFGPDSPDLEDEMLDLLTNAPDRHEVWMIEAVDGGLIGAGRLSRAPGARFAGLFGGAVDSQHRHQGLYRTLTSARARSALAMGAEFVYAECTEFSRPILERAGLESITTTTPFTWTRPRQPR